MRRRGADRPPPETTTRPPSRGAVGPRAPHRRHAPRRRRRARARPHAFLTSAAASCVRVRVRVPLFRLLVLSLPAFVSVSCGCARARAALPRARPPNARCRPARLKNACLELAACAATRTGSSACGCCARVATAPRRLPRARARGAGVWQRCSLTPREPLLSLNRPPPRARRRRDLRGARAARVELSAGASPLPSLDASNRI